MKKINKLTIVLLLFIPALLYAEKNKTLVWPPPPDKGRIRYLKTFRGREDVQPTKKRNWFLRLLLGPKKVRGPFFRMPQDITTDEEGRVYVSEGGYGRIFVFDFKNKKFRTFGDKGPFSLKRPIGIDYADGRIYVADTLLNRVVVYDTRTGDFIAAFGGKDVFVKATGLAVDPVRKRIYLTDTKDHNIKVLDINTGRVIARWGKRGSRPGEFNFPTHIAVGPDGRVYVSDTGNFRYQVLSSEGKVLLTVGEVGDTFGKFARPKGIDVDWKNRVYVIDSMFCNYQIFREDGRLLTFVGDCGGGPGRSMVPGGIHIDRRRRLIYVADQGNAAVDVYEFFAKDDE